MSQSHHNPAPLTLDEAAIRRAAETSHLKEGAVTPGILPYAKEICALLNDALATEWVCVLRYKRHYFTASGLTSTPIADEFLVHANEEMSHADRLAARIVQLGGEPLLDPAGFHARSHANYDDSTDLDSMIRANLVAERVAVEVYRQMIQVIGDKDPTTTRLLQEILTDEEEHADELSDWLDRA